jgi:hypothetical protein
MFRAIWPAKDARTKILLYNRTRRRLLYQRVHKLRSLLLPSLQLLKAEQLTLFACETHFLLGEIVCPWMSQIRFDNEYNPDEGR